MIKSILYPLLCFASFAFSQFIYVNPTSECTKDCIGDLSQPYKSAWGALFDDNPSSVKEIKLLNSSNSEHFMILNETGTGGLQTLYDAYLMINSSIKLSPLYCDEIGSESSLREFCYKPSFQPVLYTKTEFFRIMINGSLEIENVIFNWIEDIQKYNFDSLNLTQCSNKNQRCCQTIDIEYSYFYSDVKCSTKSIVIGSGVRDGIFNIIGDEFSFLRLKNVDFKNANFFNTSSLISIVSKGKVNMKFVKLENNFFPGGVISSSSASWDQVSMNLSEIIFQNFNPLNTIFQSEGDIGLLLQMPLSQDSNSIKLNNISFSNITLSNYQHFIYGTNSYNLEINGMKFELISLLPSISFSSSIITAFGSSSLKIQGLYFLNSIISQSNAVQTYNSTNLSLGNFNIYNSTLRTDSAFIYHSSIGTSILSDFNIISCQVIGSTTSITSSTGLVYQVSERGFINLQNIFFQGGSIQGYVNLLMLGNSSSLNLRFDGLDLSPSICNITLMSYYPNLKVNTSSIIFQNLNASSATGNVAGIQALSCLNCTFSDIITHNINISGNFIWLNFKDSNDLILLRTTFNLIRVKPVTTCVLLAVSKNQTFNNLTFNEVSLSGYITLIYFYDPGVSDIYSLTINQSKIDQTKTGIFSGLIQADIGGIFNFWDASITQNSLTGNITVIEFKRNSLATFYRLKISNNTFRGGASTWFSYCISAIESSSIIVMDSYITNNFISDSAAIVNFGIRSIKSSVTNTVISGNNVTSFSFLTPIWSIDRSASVYAYKVNFTNNLLYGGISNPACLINFKSSGQTPIFSNILIFNNTLYENSLGIRMSANGKLNFTYLTVLQNEQYAYVKSPFMLYFENSANGNLNFLNFSRNRIISRSVSAVGLFFSSTAVFGTNLTLSENYLVGSDAPSMLFIETDGSVNEFDDVMISNNYFGESSRGIYIAGFFTFADYQTTTFFNNTIIGNLYYSTAIEIVDSSILYDFRINAYNNTLISYNAGAYFFLFTSGYYFSTNFTIQGNFLSGTQARLILATLNGFTIKNLYYIENVVDKGAGLASSTSSGSLINIYFYRNTFKSNSGDSAFAVDFSYNFHFNFSIFEGNIFEDGTTGFIPRATLGLLIFNMTAQKNQFFGSSIFITSRVQIYGNMLFSRFVNNSLYDASIMCYAAQESTFIIDNSYIGSNDIYDDALLLSSTQLAADIVTNSIIENTQKKLTKSSRSSRSQALCFAGNAFLLMQSCQVRNITSFITASDGLILLDTFNFTNLVPTNGLRRLISGLNSRIWLFDINVKQDKNVKVSEEALIQSQFSQIDIVNMNYSDSIADKGYFISAEGNTISLNNMNFNNIHYQKKGALINAISSTTLTISDTTFDDVGSIISAKNIINVSISHVNYTGQALRESPIQISDTENIDMTLLDMKILSIAPNIQIDSMISISNPKTSVSISRTRIDNSTTINGGLHFSSLELSPLVNLSYVNFTNNRAFGGLGGALSIEQVVGSKVMISNCLFILNEARFSGKTGGYGGGFYISTKDSDQVPEVNITNSSFISNYAEVNGGAMYILGLPPSVDPSCIFTNNSIQGKANDFASQAIKMVSTYSNSTSSRLLQAQNNYSIDLMAPSNSMSFGGLGSGSDFNQTFSLILLDMFNQQVIDDSTSALSIVGASGFKSSKQTIVAQNGAYLISGLNFIFSPGESTVISFVTNGIKTFKNLKVNGSNDSQSIPVEISFRNCEMGEILLDSGACFKCKAGFASLDQTINTKSPCVECDTSKMTCNGGSIIIPNPGYWQMNTTADLVLECPFPDACPGSNPNVNRTPGYESCAFGYQGNLCSNCIEGLGKSSSTNPECYLCQEQTLNYIYMAVTIIVNIVLIGITVKSALTSAFTQNDDPSIISTNLIKNIVNFVQIASLLTAMNIKWPSDFEAGVQVSNQVVITKPDLYSPDCLYTDFKKEHDIKVYYFKYLLSNITPFLIFGLFVLIWIIIFKLKLKRNLAHPSLATNLVATFVVIVFKLQVPIIQSNLQIFRCQNLYRSDSALSFLQADYDIECWTDEHYHWIYYFFTPFTILWGVLLPGYLFISLFRSRGNLEEKSVRKKYSFIFKGYKDDKFYWEFIIMIRKYAIMAIAIFLSESPDLQIFLSIYVIWLSYLLEIKNKPYTVKSLNNLEELNLICGALINLSGLYFSFEEKRTGLEIFFICLIYFGLLGYLAFWLKMFIPSKFDKIIKKLQKKIEKKDQNIEMIDVKSEIIEIPISEENRISVLDSGKKEKKF